MNFMRWFSWLIMKIKIKIICKTSFHLVSMLKHLPAKIYFCKNFWGTHSISYRPDLNLRSLWRPWPTSCWKIYIHPPSKDFWHFRSKRCVWRTIISTYIHTITMNFSYICIMCMHICKSTHIYAHIHAIAYTEMTAQLRYRVSQNHRKTTKKTRDN